MSDPRMNRSSGNDFVFRALPYTNLMLFFFSEMTSKQVQDDNEAMSNTMYKLLKKYQAIRSIIKTLHVSYVSANY